MRTWSRTKRWLAVAFLGLAASVCQAGPASVAHPVPVASPQQMAVPYIPHLATQGLADTPGVTMDSTAAGISVVANIKVTAIPATVPIRPSYAVFPDSANQYFCSYQITVVLATVDNSQFAVIYTCDKQDSTANTNLAPEDGLGCFFTDPNTSTPGNCQLSINRATNTYQLAVTLPASVAYANVGIAGIYVDGQVTGSASTDYSIPQRVDSAISTGLSGSFSISDSAGDVSNGSVGCSSSCKNTAALDQGIDLLAIAGTYSGTVGQPTYTGVKLDLEPSRSNPVAIGETYGYTLTLRNNSTVGLTAAIISDVFPSQVAFQGAGCGQNGSGGFSWTLGSLAAGASVACQVNVKLNSLPASYVIHNTATAAFQFAGGQTSSISATSDVGTVRPAAPSARTVSGAPTTKDSSHASLSADGKLVAFSSLDSGYLSSDNNGVGPDVYLLDKRTGTVKLLSVSATSGAQLVGAADRPVISGNGQAVAFLYNTGSTTAASAKPGQAGLTEATTTTICVAPPNGLFKPNCLTGTNGQPVNGSAENPSLSADGRYMAFCSAASNIPGTVDTNNAKDVFVLDQTLGVVKVVSTTSAGVAGNGDSCEAMISGDGKSVVFSSKAANFGTNGVNRQVFRKDLASNALTLISKGLDANPANTDAGTPTVSYDGKRITFASRASNLATGISSVTRNIWVYDETAVVSASNKIAVVRGAGGVLPNQDSEYPVISCNGRVVAFDTLATNLAGSDTNGKSDIYLYDVDTKVVRRAVAPQAGVEPNGGSTEPVLDCEGNTMAFESSATNLSSGDPNSNDDIYGQDNPLRADANAVTVDGSFSGNWFNSGNDGQGFLIEALSLPGSPFYVTWYTFQNGQPVFLQGVASAAGNVLSVDMTSAKSTGFPAGGGGATAVTWGKLKLSFTDANSGLAEWTPTASGYSAGSFTIRRLTTPALIQSDAGQTLKACYSGIWSDPNKPGYGLDLEVNDFDAATRLLTVYWYTYQPSGIPLWLVGTGAAVGGKVNLDLYQVTGSGAQFPPAYAKAGTAATKWGSATVTFTGNNALSYAWTPTAAGYAAGSGNLTRLTSLTTRTCQ